MSPPPRCPRCEGLDVEPYETPLEASDQNERILSTHRCLNQKCAHRLEPFRNTPPAVDPAPRRRQ